MTVYAYSKVAVYAELGGAIRLARNARSFVTDTVTGLPVDVTQGARVAPYLDSDANGIADFTAENPGPLRLTTGTVFTDVYSNELPGIALDAVTAAEAAQAAAEAAVTAATGPADATVAGLISAASATQTAGDARWSASTATAASIGLGNVDNTTDLAKPVSTATADAIAALQSQSASIEDLFTTVTLQPQTTPGTSWPNTGNTSFPLFSAPFPLAITSVTMLMFSATGNAPLSDTSYWLVEISKYNPTNTLTTMLAQKSTKTTAVASPGGPASDGVPAGTAIAARKPWSFGAGVLAGATLDAGDSLAWITFPVSTPVAMYGPVTVTIGYRPL